MRRFSKVIGLVVVGVLCIALFVGCGDKNKENEQPDPIQTTDSSPNPVETATPPPVQTNTPAPTDEPTESPAAGEDGEESESGSDGESSGSEILKEKSEGSEVGKVQEKLKELGYLDKVTNYFGTDTKTAVEKFQERNDLDVDGMVGPGTKKVLFSDDAKEAA